MTPSRLMNSCTVTAAMAGVPRVPRWVIARATIYPMRRDEAEGLGPRYEHEGHRRERGAAGEHRQQARRSRPAGLEAPEEARAQAREGARAARPAALQGRRPRLVGGARRG